MKALFTILGLFLTIFIQAQNTQTIRGKVVDQASQIPLIGAVVLVEATDFTTTTDIDGNFILENIPVGRQTVIAQYLGYESYRSEGLLISTGKVTYLEIGLLEQVQTTRTVVVTTKDNNDVGNKPLNELSIISARSFSVEETKRYAASIDDPGRMAGALPGIRTDSDDENDIIVRGNSSFGVLWRLEGLEIPSPNHFGRSAATGGGITAFSAAVLGNTDLLTGGFSAEYGNALSGVFDMRNRRGNMVEREYSIKIGFVGLGASAEGPIKKGRSSYLVNYRYSTLGLLNAFGIYAIGDNVSNDFQDLSFNLTFNSKDNKNEVKVFGVGGLSNELFLIKEDTAEWYTIYDYIGERSGSNLGIFGVSFRRLLNQKSYLKIVAGTVYNNLFLEQHRPNLITYDINDLTLTKEFDYHTLRSQLHATYSNKFSKYFRLKTGLSFTANTYDLDYFEGVQFLDEVRGTTFIGQAFVQGSYRPISNLTINVGMHALFLTLNNTYSLEPRLAVQYKPTPTTAINAAYTWHGKVLPIGTYLLQLPDGNGGTHQPNRDLKIAKMQHVILGIQQALGKGFTINVEGYYQYGNDQPTSPIPNSGFWLFNQRSNYGMQEMSSDGQVRNYGVDATFEKSFSRRFFVLLTGSLFWSEFKSKDDTEWRRTRVDKRWGTNLMGGYEFEFKKGGVLQIGLKNFISGGLRYNLPDVPASFAANEFIPDPQQLYAAAGNTFFRLDTRIAYRKDHKKLSYTISIDVQNVTNASNRRFLLYDHKNMGFVPRYQSGLVPVLSFQLDF